ncbi:MAG: cysteine desulfuration protein SufE [Paracoccaceae bacterium]|jgi:cysteine desulfuration protein SufE
MTKPPEAFEDIVDAFAYLDDWEDRYSHVIELGRAMPPLEDMHKSAASKVDGCASQVWIVPRLEDGPPRRLHFDGDSDALIVKGLIAILHALVSGRTPAEIMDTDVEAELARLDLSDHLSSQRSNGLRAMIARVRTLAAAG